MSNFMERVRSTIEDAQENSSEWDLLPLEELEDEELEAIANLKGGNELAQKEARDASQILDRRRYG